MRRKSHPPGTEISVDPLAVPSVSICQPSRIIYLESRSISRANSLLISTGRLLTMNGLMIITAVLVTITMAAAVITARELETLKARLAKLEEFRDETYHRLSEVKEYRQSIEGTRDMLNNLVHTRLAQQKDLEAELKQLEEMVVGERQISVSKPPHASSDDDENVL